MSAYRFGDVYIRDKLAGRICETEYGYDFTYEDTWL